MKKAYLILLIIALPFQLIAQSVFKKMYGYFSGPSFILSEIPNSNQFILANHNDFYSRHTFFKITNQGDVFDQVYLSQDVGGNFGSYKFYHPNDSLYDFIGIEAVPDSFAIKCFIMRRDTSLQNLILSKDYEFPLSAFGIDSWLNIDSTYSIAGGFNISLGVYYPIIFKLNSNLNVEWSRSYQDHIGYVIQLIESPSNNGWYLLMQLASQGMALTKIDNLGNVEWSKIYDSNYRYPNGILNLENGNLLIYGYKNPSNTTGFCGVDGFITKVDSSGNVIWSKKLGDSNLKFFRSGVEKDLYVEKTFNNNLILCGTVQKNNNPNLDFIFSYIDSSGNILWSRRYGNSYFNEIASTIHQTTDSGFIIAGYNDYLIPPPFPPNPDAINPADVTVIKTDSMGFSDGCMEYSETLYYESDTPSVTNLLWNVYIDSLVTEVPSTLHDTTGTPTRNEDMCTYVSVQEIIKTSSSILISPNPNTGNFDITLTDHSKYPSTIEIIDAMGRLAWSESVNEERLHISLQNSLPPGFYSIRLITGNEIRYNHFIVQ